MEHKEQRSVRNIAIIGNVNAGKVTLMNFLLAMGRQQHCITRQDQTGMYIMHNSDFEFKGQNIEATYICARGNLDYVDEISSILRVVDGAFIMVDALEGVTVLVEIALRKCIQERVEPIVVLNKVEALLQHTNYAEERLYNIVMRLMQRVNEIMKESQGFKCNIKENFLFASLEGQLVLNRKTLIHVLEYKDIKIPNIDKDLWFDFSENEILNNKAWTIESIISPVCQLIKALREEALTIDNQPSDTSAPPHQPSSAKSPITYSTHSSNLLKKCIMEIFPSPQEAQEYRTPVLYTGDLIDPCGQAMQKCSPEGPLMMYVISAINNQDSSDQNIYRLSRIYSGTLKKGEKVRILDRKYKFGSQSNIFSGTIREIIQLREGEKVFLEEARAGSIVCVSGVDHKIIRAATITNLKLAHPITQISSTEKRITASIRSSPENHNKMLEALKELSRRKQGLRYKIEETGEAFVLGASMSSILAYISELKEILHFEITTSEPFVRVRETITKPSSQKAVVANTDDQTKVEMTSLPLNQKLCGLIQDKEIKFYGDKEARNRRLEEEFGWDSESAMRIWSFGPGEKGSNILVDQSNLLKHIQDIKDPVIEGFQRATRHGILVDEHLCGMRVNIQSISVSEDPLKRSAEWIINPVVRSINECQLYSSPAILEPIFRCQLKIKEQDLKEISQMIQQARGEIIDVGDLEYKKMVSAFIPGLEKKIFEDRFQSSTPSMEYFQSIYDHDQIIQNFSLEEGTPTYKLVMQLRKMKGLELSLLQNENQISNKRP